MLIPEMHVQQEVKDFSHVYLGQTSAGSGCVIEIQRLSNVCQCEEWGMYGLKAVCRLLGP